VGCSRADAASEGRNSVRVKRRSRLRRGGSRCRRRRGGAGFGSRSGGGLVVL
jgi:hypothetical protein